MRFNYYPEKDTAYILLQEGVSSDSEEFMPNIVLDYKADYSVEKALYKSLIGIEIEMFKSFNEAPLLSERLTNMNMPQEMVEKVIKIIETQVTKIIPYSQIVEL